MSREQEAREAIESAVETILDGYDALTSVFDGYSDVVSSEQAAKTFLFLVNTHNAAQAQVAEVVRQAEAARAPKKRRFSLDTPSTMPDRNKVPVSSQSYTVKANPGATVTKDLMAWSGELTEEDEAALARAQAYADETPAKPQPRRPQTAEDVRRQRVEQYKRLGGRLSANSPDIDPTQPTAPIMGTPGAGGDYVPHDVGFLDEDTGKIG